MCYRVYVHRWLRRFRRLLAWQLSRHNEERVGVKLCSFLFSTGFLGVRSIKLLDTPMQIKRLYDYSDIPCNTPEQCRFVHEGTFSTEMYSPIEYNRQGEPVGGGNNKITRSIKCLHCQKVFCQNATELEFAVRSVPWEIVGCE